MEFTTWNTGCLYSEHGQRMAATVVDGEVYFLDLDRRIDGHFEVSPCVAMPVKDSVDSHYLHNDFAPIGYSAAEHDIKDGLHAAAVGARSLTDKAVS